MDKAIALLGQLFGNSNHKKLSLIISFIFLISFWILFYFLFGKPIESFSFKLLNISLWWHIFSIGAFGVGILIFSGWIINFFTEKILEYFYEKNWIIAFNHVWGGGEQIRCINDGNYVHIRSVDNSNNIPPVIFYTFCSVCKTEKRLIHDNGHPITLSNAQNVIKGIRESWKNHNFVVEDKKGNFYCKQCYSWLNYPVCPFGCLNAGVEDEIEKIKKARMNVNVPKKAWWYFFFVKLVKRFFV